MTKTEQVYTYILSHSPYTLDYKELSKNLSIKIDIIRTIVNRLLKDKYILQSGDKKTGQILTINSDKTMDTKVSTDEILWRDIYIHNLETALKGYGCTDNYLRSFKEWSQQGNKA